MNQRSYDDIIDLPRPISDAHPHMPLRDRAAQFAPFKALSGYEEDMEETARPTDERIELDESRIAQLDARLRLLGGHLADMPAVTVTYFRPDERKNGGAYRTLTGQVKKLDVIARCMVFLDGERIPFADIYQLEGELFRG